MNTELHRQHHAHVLRRAKLFNKPYQPPPEPVVVAVEPEPKKPVIKPLWQIIDLNFDWHVSVWKEAIDCQISDIAHENIALRAALRIAGLDLELAKSPRRPAKEIISDVLANFPDVTWDDLKSQRRTRDIVFPRQLAMYELYVQRRDLSFPAIGRLFGGRDHTTVLHAVNKIKLMSNDDRDAAIYMQRKYKQRSRKPWSVRRDEYMKTRLREISRENSLTA